MIALISVSDKTGIVEFAHALVELGITVISTGGTASTLQSAGIPVTPIEAITEFPEMMNGRLKTLHPRIHGGILAIRDNPDHMADARTHQIPQIDLVVVNLYPFEATISKPDCTRDEAIENIDIGGPAMIRSAAKNHADVAVVVNPSWYSPIIDELKTGGITLATRKKLACEAFSHTAAYDQIIATYLQSEAAEPEDFPATLTRTYTKIASLRYGENPHQSAAWYLPKNARSPITVLGGKPLSYTNLLDISAAIDIVSEFDHPTAVIIKHTNPCGAAAAAQIGDAYRKAYDCDPVSAFGSIVGLNRLVDFDTAQELAKTFIEVIVAPEFDADALALLTQKPALRLIQWNADSPATFTIMQTRCGFLVQTPDDRVCGIGQFTLVTKALPTYTELRDMEFGFSIVKHVKSNAVILVKDAAVVGVGAGQMSRVEATEIAIKKAGDRARGAVAASDAFFPFPDSVELLAAAGVRAIVQPGGSKRDDESIACCNSNKISMFMTGIRHFRH